MSHDGGVVIEVFGEGKADVGHDPTPGPPTAGVVPILLHRLCGKPRNMLVRRHGAPFMQGAGTLRKKVRFAKRQARINGSSAATFVMDSEGDLNDRKDDLDEGRRMEPGDFPMAVGVAHPCIEAWLLADEKAIARALALELPLDGIPDNPEALSAPRQDRKHNPKTVLAAVVGSGKQETSAKQKEQIATAMNDMELVRRRCPLGFDPFADEVDQLIRPLF